LSSKVPDCGIGRRSSAWLGNPDRRPASISPDDVGGGGRPSRGWPGGHLDRVRPPCAGRTCARHPAGDRFVVGRDEGTTRAVTSTRGVPITSLETCSSRAPAGPRRGSLRRRDRDRPRSGSRSPPPTASQSPARRLRGVQVTASAARLRAGRRGTRLPRARNAGDVDEARHVSPHRLPQRQSMTWPPVGVAGDDGGPGVAAPKNLPEPRGPSSASEVSGSWGAATFVALRLQPADHRAPGRTVRPRARGRETTFGSSPHCDPFSWRFGAPIVSRPASISLESSDCSSRLATTAMASRKLRARGDFELGEDPVEVRADRAVREEQTLADLSVSTALAPRARRSAAPVR